MYPLISILHHLEDSFLSQNPISLEPLIKSRVLTDTVLKISIQTCILNGFVYYCNLDEQRNIVLSNELPVRLDNSYIPLNKRMVLPLHKKFVLSPDGYRFLKWFKTESHNSIQNEQSE